MQSLRPLQLVAACMLHLRTASGPLRPRLSGEWGAVQMKPKGCFQDLDDLSR